MQVAWSETTRRLIRLAIDEDLGSAGDLSAQLLPPSAASTTARVVLRKAGVLCGLALGQLVCDEFAARLGARLAFTPRPGVQDGDPQPAGKTVAEVTGPLSALLSTERTLLNFLMRLCGVATVTRAYVAAAAATNPHVRVLDTRKTIPGWRELDKYAVRCGGGLNHRHGLHDAVLIKDNHIAGVPAGELPAYIDSLVSRAACLPTRPAFLQLEVDSLDQLDAVLGVAGVDMILLDNFDLAGLRAAVQRRDACGRNVLLEASGGVTLATIGAIAATGVDRISVGALTHSAVALDVGLDL